MKKVILLLVICISFNGYTQELKKKKKTSQYFKEIFYIDKANKLKSGDYIKLNLHSKDTLEKGKYLNGEKIGIWNYYSKNNELYLTYNHEKDSIVSISDEYIKIEKFFVLKEGNYELLEIETPPIFLGSPEVLKYFFYSAKLSEKFFKKPNPRSSIFSIEINKNGESKLIVEQNIENTIDESLIKRFNEKAFKWTPAKSQGKNINSRILINYIIRPESLKALKLESDQPYSRIIELYYFGV